MAASNHHIPSNSFPSRPHPLAAHVDKQLNRLKSSESGSTSSSSICPNLKELQDLHVCIDKLLQLPLVQQALSQEKSKKCIETLLDGSLRLLDVCNVAKDALMQIKESLPEIQSTMRRKQSVEAEIKKYLATEKALKKAFSKILKPLKVADRKCHSPNDNETLAWLKEAEAITVSAFDSILCFVSGSESVSKPGIRWSLVSKLVNKRRVACDAEETDANEFVKIESALFSLIHRKSEKALKAEDLENLEMCIQDLKQGLECLFNVLIKVRVSVLNVLDHRV